MTADARRTMIDSQLRPQGVNDPDIIAAFAAIAREDYVPEARAGVAYRDRSVPLGEGRAMIAPAALGAMLMEAQVAPGAKALVVRAKRKLRGKFDGLAEIVGSHEPEER